MDQFPNEILVNILSQAYTRYVPQVCRRWRDSIYTLNIDRSMLQIIDKREQDLSRQDFRRINTMMWLRKYKLADWFVTKYLHEDETKICISRLIKTQKLSESDIQSIMIMQESSKIIRCIIKYQCMSESLIREMLHIHNDPIIENGSELIWYYQVVSEDFIREFKDRVNWYYISMSQILSEDFIREFEDNVVWYNIRKYQILSREFLEEFRDKK